MSRYIITVTKAASNQADPAAVIGYDRPLETFFRQAFADPGDDDLDLWLSTDYQTFETLSVLRAAALIRGYDFVPLASGVLNQLYDDRRREAIRPAVETIIQELASRRAS